MRRITLSFVAGLALISLTAPGYAQGPDQPKNHQPADEIKLPIHALSPHQVGLRLPHGPSLPAPAGPPAATRVYDTLGGSYHFFGNAPCVPRPHRAIDDGHFTPGPGAGGGGLSQVRLAVAVPTDPNVVGPVAVDVELQFFDTLGVGDPNLPAGQLPLGGVVLTLADLPVGAISVMAEPIDISFANIIFPDDDWGVQIRLLRPGLQLPATYATIAFSTTEPARGSSADLIYLDQDCDNKIEVSESFTFGGPPQLANFAIALYFPGGECVGDINGDSSTCQSDLGILLAAYGTCADDPLYDAAAAGLAEPLDCVDQADLGVLLADYGCGDCAGP